MSFVLDNSVAPTSCFEDERTPATAGLLNRLATLRLAERFALSVYDAAYLELAQHHRLPLASLDQDLPAAAGALGLDVLGS